MIIIIFSASFSANVITALFDIMKKSSNTVTKNESVPSTSSNKEINPQKSRTTFENELICYTGDTVDIGGQIPHLGHSPMSFVTG